MKDKTGVVRIRDEMFVSISGRGECVCEDIRGPSMLRLIRYVIRRSQVCDLGEDVVNLRFLLE